MELSLEELYQKNQGFLYRLAKYYEDCCNELGIELEDLYQVGCLALCNNYHKYDSSKGALSTFTHGVIRYAMLNYIKDNSTVTHIPTDLYTISRRYANQNISFYKIQGRKMTEQEQLEWISKLKLKKYYSDNNNAVKMLNTINKFHYKNCVDSLEEEFKNYDNNDESEEILDTSLIKDLIIDECSMEDEIISKVDLVNFLNSLSYLKRKELNTFLERLGLVDGEPKTLEMLAEKENISFQAISKRYKKTLVKIREKNNLI